MEEARDWERLFIGEIFVNWASLALFVALAVSAIVIIKLLTARVG